MFTRSGLYSQMATTMIFVDEGEFVIVACFAHIAVFPHIGQHVVPHDGRFAREETFSARRLMNSMASVPRLLPLALHSGLWPRLHTSSQPRCRYRLSGCRRAVSSIKEAASSNEPSRSGHISPGASGSSRRCWYSGSLSAYSKWPKLCCSGITSIKWSWAVFKSSACCSGVRASSG